MGKVKNRILVYIALAIFIVIGAGNHPMQARDKLDLTTITDILQKDDKLSIEKWSVFARELNNKITTKEEFENKVRALKKENPEFHWNIAVDQAEWKAEATLPHAENNVTELIKMVTTVEHNNNVTYIIYEVTGQHWESKNIAFLQSVFQHKINGIFTENPSVFSCVQGSINDTIDSVLTTETEKLLNMFNAKEIEGVREKNFSSISAHSTLFTQTIANEEINVQVGLRRDGLGSRTSFVIGTPIITFEY